MSQQISSIIQIIISASTLVGMIIMAYRSFRDPDVKADSEINLIKQGCALKHTRLDQILDRLGSDMRMIQENDLKHIEKEMAGVKEKQIEIFTILQERLPPKNQ